MGKFKDSTIDPKKLGEPFIEYMKRNKERNKRIDHARSVDTRMSELLMNGSISSKEAEDTISKAWSLVPTLAQIIRGTNR